MKRNLVGMAALAAASMLLAGGAAADGMRSSVKDAPMAPCCDANWNGLYIGAAVGYGIATTDVDVTKQSRSKYEEEPWGEAFSLLNIDGLSSDGAQGTLSLGYDRQVHPGFLVGIFADYTFGELENDIGLFEGFAKLNSEIGNTWSVGGRLGLVRQSTLWYVMAGYTEADLDWALHFDGTKVAGDGETLSGYFVGLGVEHHIGRNLFLELEYRYSDYDETRLFSYDFYKWCKENRINVDTDTDVHSIRLGVNWKMDLFHRSEAPAPLK